MGRGALRAAIIALLVVSLSLKLAVFRSDPGLAAAALPAKTRQVLGENGFENIRELDDGRMMTASRGACEVLIARVTPDGSQAEAVRRLAPEGALVSSLDDAGPAAGEKSAAEAVAGRVAERFRFYFGGARTAEHLMLIQTRECPRSIIAPKQLR